MSSFFSLKFLRIASHNLLFALILLILFFSSCKVTKPSGYFNALLRDTSINSQAFSGEEFVIIKGDILDISVSSLNSDLDTKFNAGSKSFIMNNAAIGEKGGYLVDNSGSIVLHFVGKIPVAGMSTSTLKARLENELTSYLKEPIVNVRITNRKVTVTGEVVNPKVITMDNEALTLLDAIALSGGVGENANLNDILILRDSSDVKLVKHVSLRDHTIFNSPLYYLKYNDMVYVNRDYTRIDKAEAKRNLQTTMSVIVSVVSLTITIINNLVK